VGGLAVSADADVDLRVELAGIPLRNPVLTASGTFGYGIEYGDVIDVDRLGAICCKGTTLKPRIEEAHRDLGYPDTSFDRTLEQAIVSLLRTPVPDAAARLDATVHELAALALYFVTGDSP